MSRTWEYLSARLHKSGGFGPSDYVFLSSEAINGNRGDLHEGGPMTAAFSSIELAAAALDEHGWELISHAAIDASNGSPRTIEYIFRRPFRTADQSETS